MPETWRATIEQRQADLKRQNRRRFRRELQSPQRPESLLDQQAIINFSSNDYLGLANHPDLIEAACNANQRWGVGSGASHLVSGHQTPHHQLEQQIADLVGAERALLFSCGYMANLAICTALATKRDLVLQDKLNHASLIDGANLSGARFARYAHRDTAHAELKLKKSDFDNAMLMTDGVFSMDGDIAPLAELKSLADRHQALLVVDDAHGIGCVGDTGRGALEVSGLRPRDNLLLMGTLGKAFGSFGAFVAADDLYIEQLIQSARSYIYTTALPPAVAAVSHRSIELVQRTGRALRQRLNQRIQQFRDGAANIGLELMPSDTPIQPLVVGDEQTALIISDQLLERGFYATAIRPPTVPANTSRLRITLSAEHTEPQVAKLLDALVETRAAVIGEVNERG